MVVDIADAVGRVPAECQVRISNQAKRVEQLIADFDAIIRDGALQFACARRLRGRLLFAKSVCYGRYGAAALRTINEAITAASGTSRDAQLPMHAELRMALGNLRQEILGKPVHSIGVRAAQPVHIFTDGACEPLPSGELEGTIGGVLVDPASSKYLYFMGAIEPRVMRYLLSLSANPICQVELLAVLASFVLLNSPLAGRPCVVWVDNEATKAALIKACSGQAHIAEILAAVALLESATQMRCWFERVPSLSNISDAPSRGRPPPPVLGLTPDAVLLDPNLAPLVDWGVTGR